MSHNLRIKKKKTPNLDSSNLLKVNNVLIFVLKFDFVFSIEKPLNSIHLFRSTSYVYNNISNVYNHIFQQHPYVCISFVVQVFSMRTAFS